MVDGTLCTVCGNEVDPAAARCPFCKHARKTEPGSRSVEKCRVVNLKRGMPLVREALKRLDLEVETAARTGCGALVLIHGYGSTGMGGSIKKAVRRQLQLMMDRKILSDVLPGEECIKRSPHARQVMKRFPCLEEFVKRANPGITLVLL